MINWAILGAGNIAKRFSKSIINVKNANLYGIYARDEKKAVAFKEEFNAEVIYKDEYELLNDKNVDAVYVALPTGLHYRWVKETLRHKKAVMVEKPAMMNLKEATDIVNTAKEYDTLFMEALKTRFVPLYQRLKEMIINKEIGEIISIDTILCSNHDMEKLKKTHIYKGDNGGSLLDSGPYCLAYIDDFLPDVKVEKVISRMVDQRDFYIEAIFDKGSIITGFDRALGKKCFIKGTKKSIVIEDLHRPVKMLVDNKEVLCPYVYDDFYGQIEHFSNLVEKGIKESPVVPFKTLLNECRIYDEIMKETR